MDKGDVCVTGQTVERNELCLRNGPRVHFNQEDFCSGTGPYITNEVITIDVNLL